jgi:hypothetical protein
MAFQTQVEIESHGVQYRARSLSGKQAAYLLDASTALDGKDENDADAVRGGLDMAAYVTACCLLNGEGSLAFGEGQTQAVLEQVPMHLIYACFEACMVDAGLKDDDEGKPSGN